MKLTSENVNNMALECLYPDDMDLSAAQPIIVQGIMRSFGFAPERIKAHRADIASMLAELPEPFMVDKGGGWSFLQACVTATGEQWGEHPSMEVLFALGEAAGFVKCILPREAWGALPGGMPYYQVDLGAAP